MSVAAVAQPQAPPALRRHPGWWALWLVSRLPWWALYRLADLIAFVLYRVVGYRRRVVQENLAKSFPEKPDAERRLIERRFYRNLADIIVETVKLSSVKPHKLFARVTHCNSELVLEYLERGQTVLMLGAHLGNWEWLLPTGASPYPGIRADGIYRPLHSAFGEQLLTYIRTRTGGRLIRMQDVGRDVVRQRELTRIICMVADQTPPGSEAQFFTRFLNQDTPFFVGPDKLAAAFQLPVFYVSTRRLRRGHYEVTSHLLYDGREPLPAPPKKVTDDPALHPITEAFARALEADIHRAPADYLWSHKRWKNSRPGK